MFCSKNIFAWVNSVQIRLRIDEISFLQKKFPRIPLTARRRDPARPAIQNLYLLLHVCFAFVSPYHDDPFSRSRTWRRDSRRITSQPHHYQHPHPHHHHPQHQHYHQHHQHQHHQHQHFSSIRSFSHLYHQRTLSKPRSLLHSAHHHWYSVMHTTFLNIRKIRSSRTFALVSIARTLGVSTMKRLNN